MNETFEFVLQKLPGPENFRQNLEDITPSQIDQALNSANLNAQGFMALLSPTAKASLEHMAQAAREKTLRHFGRVIQLFTPLYISNHCLNHCLYCGFSARNQLKKRKLTLDEIENEAKAINVTGLRHILLLTGDSPEISSLDYIASAVSVLGGYFSSIGLEINALTAQEYRSLIEAGADSLTIYQETYDRPLYGLLHPAGPKRDFPFRLNAPQRGAEAGFRAVNVGPLLGLNFCPPYDVFATGLHADWLRRKYPHVEVGLSLPRIRPCLNLEGNQTFLPAPVNDAEFVQYLLALRLFLPMSSISISTREAASMRDNLVKLGITRLSAGVCTAVGGHSGEQKDSPQFEISDPRSVDQMVRAIKDLGYQPVFKDWEPMTLYGQPKGRHV